MIPRSSWVEFPEEILFVDHRLPYLQMKVPTDRWTSLEWLVTGCRLKLIWFSQKIPHLFRLTMSTLAEFVHSNEVMLKTYFSFQRCNFCVLFVGGWMNELYLSVLDNCGHYKNVPNTKYKYRINIGMLRKLLICFKLYNHFKVLLWSNFRYPFFVFTFSCTVGLPRIFCQISIYYEV